MRHGLKLSWLIALAGLLAGGAPGLFWWPRPVPLALTGLCLGLQVLAVAALVLALVRLRRFSRRLSSFLDQLLLGHYGTGLRQGAGPADELSALEAKINRFAEQLQTYDALRAARVAFLSRGLDQLLRSIADAVLMIDVPKAVLRLNPAAQRALGVDVERVDMAALRNQADNAEMFQHIDEVIGKQRVGREVATHIRLPGGSEATAVALRLVPVKLDSDHVDMVLMLLQLAVTAGVAGQPP